MLALRLLRAVLVAHSTCPTQPALVVKQEIMRLYGSPGFVPGFLRLFAATGDGLADPLALTKKRLYAAKSERDAAKALHGDVTPHTRSGPMTEARRGGCGGGGARGVRRRRGDKIGVAFVGCSRLHLADERWERREPEIVLALKVPWWPQRRHNHVLDVISKSLAWVCRMTSRCVSGRGATERADGSVSARGSARMVRLKNAAQLRWCFVDRKCVDTKRPRSYLPFASLLPYGPNLYSLAWPALQSPLKVGHARHCTATPSG
jgi:hypothetical protein